MKNFENPKNIFNNENITEIDQLASKEEAITISERKELLENNIKELESRHSVLMVEFDRIINDIESGMINNVKGQELAKEKNEMLNQIAYYLEEDKMRLNKLEDFSQKISKELDSISNKN